MTGDGFSVDVQQLEALSKSWNAAVKQVEALPGKISSIESNVRQAAQQKEFSEETGEEIDLSAIQAEGSNFNDFTKILNTAASQLKTLISQLEQDAQLIQRCSVEYQIADDAAANGITNISSALSSNAAGSTQITSLLNSLTGDSGTALTAAQGLVTANAAPAPTPTPQATPTAAAAPATGGTTSGGGGTTTAGAGTVSDPGPSGSTGSTGTTGASAPASTTSGATTTAGTTAAATTAAATTAAATTAAGTTAGTTSSAGTTTAGTTGAPTTTSTTTPTTTSGTSTSTQQTGSGTGTGTGTGKDAVANTTGGDWKTSGTWNSAPHGPTTGQGMKTKLPDYDKLPKARQQIMNNMVARVDKKVGYSQSATTNGYRDDSTGAVSAAWGLPKPGLDTTQLTASTVAHKVTKDQLQPGDALVSNDHAVVFGGWANSTHTEYYALENDPSQGTVAHVAPYPYWPAKGKTDAAATFEAYAKNDVS